MPSTFDIVADIVAETCHIPRETISLDSDLLRDLGIDSLDLFDIGFALDDAFGISVPVEQWLQAGTRSGRRNDASSCGNFAPASTR